jgi:hypothetical protein
MLGALLSQVKGVFGKAYLYAGLIPASALVFGWALFRAGRQGLQQATADIFITTRAGIGGPLLHVVALLGLALFFFAIRQFLVSMLETLPIPVVRNHLVSRQVQRRQRALVRLEEALTQRTAASWPGRGFTKPFVYQSVTVLPPGKAVAASSRARAKFEKALAADKVSSLSRHEANEILGGLAAILVIEGQSADSPAEVKSEIKKWDALHSKRGAGEVLAAVTLEADRRFVKSRRGLSRWPAEAWIEPTALGNRQAALDDYAQGRYGIDTGSLWVRLVGVLDPAERAEVSDAELSVEVMVNLSVALAALALGAAAVILFRAVHAVGTAHAVPTWTEVLFILVPIALARAAYEGAVYAHRGLALRIIRLVDLRRLRLVQELGYSITTVEEEMRLFKELKGFFSSGTPRSPSRTVITQQPPQAEATPNE